MDNLKLFFSKIKELTFWQRIFKWTRIRSLSYEAHEEFKTLERGLDDQKKNLEDQRNKLVQINAENMGLENQLKDNQITLSNYERKIGDYVAEVSNLKIKLTEFRSLEEGRGKQYENRISALNQANKEVSEKEKRLSDKRMQEREEELEKMKKQWATHQSIVEKKIKLICRNYVIKYEDKVSFSGNPDNAIEICDQMIVFDAKSPANDDLSNFPSYIKTQAEIVKKYAKQESVKNDIFLVIPSNTSEIIEQKTYNMADYNVYVITEDSLEPVILTLKKIEEYEFADQMSPDERDKICRIIGKFAHATKRKIQIDQFFNNHLIEILIKCKNDLPEELLDAVVEFEKAEKLNPSIEKRKKQILTKEIKDRNEKINAEASIRGIEIPKNFDDLKKIE